MNAAESIQVEAVQSLGNQTTWLDAAVRWAQAVLCLARNQLNVAEAFLVQMRDIAVECEHEQMACMAHLLLSLVFERSGNVSAVLAEQRRLRLRERRMVQDSVAAKEAIVALQLSARSSEVHLRNALDQSRLFEKWSLEDALTGAPNRRRFTMDMARVLREAGERGTPTTVAMIDVDKFKAINDRFTHEVGDRVLKTLAAIMSSEIRDQDMLARWAGDEFVIRFAADMTVATAACRRIQETVAAFDWKSIAAGLRVAVTVGLGAAEVGDTVESVVRRGDESMYGRKPPA